MNGIEIYDMENGSYVWYQYGLLQGHFPNWRRLNIWWQKMRRGNAGLPVNPIVKSISMLGL